MAEGPGSDVFTVGWRELAALPDWGVSAMVAKVDTGARTSAVDVADLEELDDGRVRFRVVLGDKAREDEPWVVTRPVRVTRVRPSSGKVQTRFVCRTRLRLGPVEREIEVSLVRRHGMLCRMLVGRRALEGLLVDPTRRYLHGKLPRRRRKRTES